MIGDILKARIAGLRERYNVPPFDGNLEDIRYRIEFMNSYLGRTTKVISQPEYHKPKQEQPKMSVADKLKMLNKK